MSGSSLKDAFDRDGYVVAPQVLSADQVHRLRSIVHSVLDDVGVAKAGGMVLPNAAVCAPELGWLFTLPALVEASRDVLGSDALMFTFEADLHRNYLASAWHKDTGEGQMSGGYFGIDPFGRDDCRIVKLGIYLQDHLDGSGLRMQPGTHRQSEVREGDGVAVPSRAGDVVLFDVRITHRGTRPSLVDQGLRAFAKLLPSERRGRAADSLRRSAAAVKGRPDRLVIYFAFGLANTHSRTFAQRNMRRQLHDLHQSNTALPAPLVSAFAEADVAVASLTEDASIEAQSGYRRSRA